MTQHERNLRTLRELVNQQADTLRSVSAALGEDYRRLLHDLLIAHTAATDKLSDHIITEPCKAAPRTSPADCGTYGLP